PADPGARPGNRDYADDGRRQLVHSLAVPAARGGIWPGGGLYRLFAAQCGGVLHRAAFQLFSILYQRLQPQRGFPDADSDGHYRWRRRCGDIDAQVSEDITDLAPTAGFLLEWPVCNMISLLTLLPSRVKRYDGT